jgi:ABC-type nitrate/sulfonate/bicarbonate transport system permease component
VQYYITGPERLWAAVVTSALLGLVAVGLVRLAEQLLTRSGFHAAAADGLA